MVDDLFSLFTKDGTMVLSTMTSNSCHLPPDTWALADSNALVYQLCSTFLSTSKDVWIVQATSLSRKQWYAWSKDHGAGKYVIDWFPCKELVALGLVCDILVNVFFLLNLSISKILTLDTDKLQLHYE